MTHRVLIVEDDTDIARLLRLHLADIHCETDLAQTGAQALDLCRQRAYHLVILDLMLPDMDGLDVCRRLREREDYIPILILTSRSGELDRVLGLELGGDDYLTKPFSVAELLARVKALLRRVAALSQPPAQEVLTRGDLCIQVDQHRVTVAGQAVDLTAREFDLLVHFARHPGRVFTRTQLLDQVWGHAYEGYEHTVNSHINRLRAKLEADPARPRFVLTVWGVGYRFTDAFVKDRG